MVGIVTAVLAVIALLVVLMLPVRLFVSFSGREVNFFIKVAGITVFKNKKHKKAQAEPHRNESEKKSFEKHTETLTGRIRAYAAACKTAVRLTRKYVRVENARVFVSVGTGDAALTAVAVGAMWALLSGAMSAVGSVSVLDKPKIDVSPEYQNAFFKAEGGCIISSRIVYIIIIAFETKRKLKPKKGKEE